LSLSIKSELPSAFPSLELFFAQCRIGDRVVKFDVYESIHSVLLGETRHGARAVFEDATGEISRHADVKRTISTAC
jgi:hypothetical protein